MRVLLGLLLAGTVLAACVSAGGDQTIIEVPLGDIPAGEVAGDATAEPASVPESEPEPEPEPAPEPTPEPAPDLTPEPAPPVPSEPPAQARARAACDDQNGLFTRRSEGLYTCVQRTRDGGQQCSQRSDCDGECLARSGTCTPFTPLFGCHEVLSGPGRRETVCLD